MAVFALPCFFTGDGIGCYGGRARERIAGWRGYFLRRFRDITDEMFYCVEVFGYKPSHSGNFSDFPIFDAIQQHPKITQIGQIIVGTNGRERLSLIIQLLFYDGTGDTGIIADNNFFVIQSVDLHALGRYMGVAIVDVAYARKAFTGE